MPPFDHEVDWDDQPRRHEVHLGLPRFPLPGADGQDGPPWQDVVDAAVAGGQEPGSRAPDLHELGSMLWSSYAVTGRRLAIHRNDDVPALQSYPRTTWSRGAAGGGGLYPVNIYWVAGADHRSGPGVYQYSPYRHDLTRLLAGDVRERVRRALGPEEPGAASYALLAVPFWRNAFKYNSFCQHVVQSDIGTLLGSWRLWGEGHDLDVSPRLWFDEEALDALLGLDGVAQSVLAVVPFGGARLPAPHTGPVRNMPLERSRRVAAQPSTVELQREMIASPTLPDQRTAVPVPSVGRADAPTTPLLSPTRLTTTATWAVEHRRSSFGRFESTRPLSLADLHAVLAAGARGGRALTQHELPGVALLGQSVLVNHVEGVEPGAYHVDLDQGVLRLEHAGPVGGFCQRNYFLTNYNLEQAAVVQVCRSPLGGLVEALGPRGYRAVSAGLGSMSQQIYTACAALGVGCGAAFGFDNVSFAELLGTASLEGSADDEWPLLIHMIGHEVQPDAAVSARVRGRGTEGVA
jgi:SagB-type dehydrogenase family enzyme